MNTKELYGITIDLDKDNSLSQFGLDLLKQFYLKDYETSPQESFARAACAYAAGDMALAQRIYNYVSDGWFMFSTPLLSNAPRPGDKWVGLPISCYASYVGDNLQSLIDHDAEIAWLSVKGGGTAGHWSDVRSVSPKAPGPIPFIKVIDAEMTAYSQGTTRRGSYAAYLDVSHPDVVEFINIRTPTGGDPNRKAYNIHNAINITDEFMEAVIHDQPFQLIDPHDKTVRDTVSARKLWQSILETRFRTGEPYLFFIDAANRALPQALKDKGFRINGSNLCTEITLITNELITFVCCLLSVCCEYYDSWKHTNMIQDLIRILDNVIDIFIANAPPELHKAKQGARLTRDLGLGVMGWHTYLQSRMVPIESVAAKALNKQIFKHISDQAHKATEQLAIERGEYPNGIGTNRRNAHLIAIAPNANSSIIANCSPSIEPSKSNAYTHKTRAGSHLVRNKYLVELLARKIPDTAEQSAIWNSIIANSGSVQHLTCLSDHERLVFRTAFEINQEWLVDLAVDRQPHICQAQSLNLFFPAHSERSYVNRCHVKAWQGGLKSLYYLRTSTGFTADKVSVIQERKPLSESTSADECLACHA